MRKVLEAFMYALIEFRDWASRNPIMTTGIAIAIIVLALLFLASIYSPQS